MGAAGSGRIAGAQVPLVRCQAVGWLLMASPENLPRLGWTNDGTDLARLLRHPFAAVHKLAELDVVTTLGILCGAPPDAATA